MVSQLGSKAKIADRKSLSFIYVPIKFDYPHKAELKSINLTPYIVVTFIERKDMNMIQIERKDMRSSENI